MKSIPIAILVVGVFTIPFSAVAQPIDLSESYAEIAFDGAESLSLLTVPDGSGNPFTRAYLPNGFIVDATVTLHVLWDDLEPIADFPSEDIWLEANDGGMISCVGATHPDTFTDSDGITQWTTPLSAGGYSESLLQVYINGDALNMSPALNIRTNSPDITSDLTVNLSDVGIFSSDFFGAYNYRSDFVCNGSLDLADVGKMAQNIGVSCP